MHQCAASTGKHFLTFVSPGKRQSYLQVFADILNLILCLRQRSGRRHYVLRVFVRRACVHASLSLRQILLARCLGYLLTEFDQIVTTNGLWGKDELRFWN